MGTVPDEELPLPRPAFCPARRRTAVHVGGDRGEDCNGSTNRKSAASREGRGSAGLDHAEINNLIAYRARLSDPFLLRPVPISVGTHRRVRLGLAFPRVHRFPFPPQFLHAGAYGREIVCTTRSAHVFLPSVRSSFWWPLCP